MRKKILLIFLYLFCIFGFSINVFAEDYSKTCGTDVNHTLTYDITKFNLDDKGILTIKGWSFIHNCDNYGGNLNNDYTYTHKFPGGTTRKINSGSDLKTVISFKNKSGAIYSKEVVFSGNRDISDDLKYGDVDNGYIYTNVDFSVEFDLNEVSSNLGNSELTMYISATLKDGISKERELAVYDDRAENYADNSKRIINIDNNDLVDIRGISNKVDVSGNRVILGSGVYFKLTACSLGNSQSDCNSGAYLSSKRYYNASGILYYDLYVKGSVTNNVISFESIRPKSMEELKNVCGWAYDDDVDGTCNGCFARNCSIPCETSNSCVVKSIKGFFVRASGNVIIKYNGNKDRVCKKSVLTKSKVLNNCDSSVNYYCGEMTVKASDGRSANISISENVSIDSSDTFLKTIIAGKGFEYNITYKDTVSWKKVSGNLTDDEINQIFNDTYYIYNKNEMVTKLNSAIKDGLNMNIYDKYKEPNFSEAGSWSCNDVKVTGNTYTAICNYKIKTASINRQTGLITGYSDTVDNNSLNGGNRYYIPLKYSDKVFKWKIQTDSGNSLSLLHVSSNKDDLTKLESPKIYIDTGDFEEKNVLSNNMCYINVKNDFYDVEDNGSSKEIKGLKFVYRSISINKPFPSNRTMPQNWQIYSDNHKGLKRLDYSYDNLVYVTEKDIRTTLSGEYDYWDKSDVDKDGKVDIVNDGKYINKKIYSVEERHCKLGEFDDGKCDIK